MCLYPQVDSCKRGSFSPGKNYNPQIIAPNSPGKNYFPQILSRLERDAQAQERQGGALMPYRSASISHSFHVDSTVYSGSLKLVSFLIEPDSCSRYGYAVQDDEGNDFNQQEQSDGNTVSNTLNTKSKASLK